MNKKLFLSLISCFLLSGAITAQDKFTKVLQDELQQQFKELQKEEFPPYHMNYRVIDKETWTLGSEFGAEMSKEHSRTRTMIPQIRIGDVNLDNFKNNSINGDSMAFLPLDDENNENSIREAIWKETNTRYKTAVMILRDNIAKKSVNAESEDKAPCFAKSNIEKYYEKDLSKEQRTLDTVAWMKRLKEISNLFNKDSKILEGSANINYVIERRYFIDIEGREVVQNLTYARLMVSSSTIAEDGMSLPLYLSYFAYDPKDLPSQEKILKDTEEIIAKLIELRTAPIVDPFTGPALLSGGASGVFFHEIFGHRIEGLRMKTDGDGQTFKKMIGQYVLPADMQVFDDPTLKQYNNEDLNGYYKFDDEGIRAERVNVVVDGKLNDFLMTRTPLDSHPRSNGHARGMNGLDAVSRQSNLIIETKQHKTDEQLRTLLIEEAKKQGKDCGYFFKRVTGGLTFTGKGSINSFNVSPLEVYKVYVDGRPDELVRGVDLIGTPLSMFSNIIYAGGQSEIFTGMCGAESGQIPVTAISPAILVNKVEVQRKPKSQNIPPILPAPEKELK